jgi:AcrR family transcriptional regulator
VLEQTTWLVAPEASSSSDAGPAEHPPTSIAATIAEHAFFIRPPIFALDGASSNEYTSKARKRILGLEEPVMAERRRAKSLDSKRRIPQRAGSAATVEAIYEATARILQKGGRDGLNTNAIAEKAGISIGTLYGYFSNKNSILLDMARREMDALRDRVVAALLDEKSNEPDAVRRAIRALVKGYGRRSPVRRILMETLFAYGGSEEMARPVHEIADLLLRHRDRVLPAGVSMPSPIGMFVITRAVDSVIRTATYEAVPFLETQEFEDEILRLVRGYLAIR